MQALKSGFAYMYLCLVVMWQKLLAKYRQFIIACNEEPDFVDVIFFNDQHMGCYEKHNDVKCPRKFCDECRLNRLISYIDNAQVCLDIAQLIITNGELCDAVVAAWTRGVNVRIVTDNQMLGSRGSQIRRLCSHCIPIRVCSERTIMHHKFVIIDGEQRILQLDQEQRDKAARLLHRRGFVMTGSLNWTKQGIRQNFENVVITSNRKVKARYQQIFDIMYNDYEPLTVVFEDDNDNGEY